MSQRHVLASSINLGISEFDHFFSFIFYLVVAGLAAFAVSVALIQDNIGFIRGRHG